MRRRARGSRFGRHAGPTGRTVGRFQPGVQGIEEAIGPSFDVAQRVVGPDAVLRGGIKGIGGNVSRHPAITHAISITKLYRPNSVGYWDSSPRSP